LKVFVEFQSLMKKFNNWQASKEIELPDGADTNDLLESLKIDVKKDLGFIIVNGIKINNEAVLKEGDQIKLFPKAFGG